jgi:methyl-accepting chemotaxis protein
MKEPNTFFQDISVRRRVRITVGIYTILTFVIGLYSLIAIVETNKRLHKSVLEGQMMVKATDTARLAQVHFKTQVQEWKNILLRGNERDLFNNYLRAFDDEDRRVNEYLQSLANMTAEMGLSVPEIAEAIKIHKKLGEQYRDALKNYNHSDLKSAVLVDKIIRGIDREPTDQIDAIANIIKSQADKRLKATETVAETQLEAYRTFSFFLIFLVLTGVCFGIYNAWSILKDLPQEENGNDTETEKQHI